MEARIYLSRYSERQQLQDLGRNSTLHPVEKPLQQGYLEIKIAFARRKMSTASRHRVFPFTIVN